MVTSCNHHCLIHLEPRDTKPLNQQSGDIWRSWWGFWLLHFEQRFISAGVPESRVSTVVSPTEHKENWLSIVCSLQRTKLPTIGHFKASYILIFLFRCIILFIMIFWKLNLFVTIVIDIYSLWLSQRHPIFLSTRNKTQTLALWSRHTFVPFLRKEMTQLICLPLPLSTCILMCLWREATHPAASV